MKMPRGRISPLLAALPRSRPVSVTLSPRGKFPFLLSFCFSKTTTSVEGTRNVTPALSAPPIKPGSSSPLLAFSWYLPQVERGKVTCGCSAPAKTMASSGLPPYSFPVPGNASLPRYEQLKEEHDMGIAEVGGPVASTVIHVGPRQVFVTPPPPSDHVVWSICSTLYCNFCCLGLMALAFSVKARDRKVLGDHSGAGSYGSTARCLNLTALILSFLVVIVFVVLVVTGVIAIKMPN